MQKKTKIQVLKKASLPLLLGPALAIPNAWAAKTKAEQAQFESCMTEKQSWVFENFNPFKRKQTALRGELVASFESELKLIDLLRLDTETHQQLLKKAERVGIPENVAEAILCVEQHRRQYPEDDNRSFNCAQSCAVTTR